MIEISQVTKEHRRGDGTPVLALKDLSFKIDGGELKHPFAVTPFQSGLNPTFVMKFNDLDMIQSGREIVNFGAHLIETLGLFKMACLVDQHVWSV